MTSIIAELTSRDLLFQVTNQDLDRIFLSDKPPVYCGFDPTSSSLHLGSLLPIMGLMQFQNAGFKPIILVGGATGMIGDPSGKSAERVLLGEEKIVANVAALEAQLRSFLDFDKGSCSALVVDNASWFNQILFVDFLRDIGKHFSIGAMLAKESVKTRLETGISFTEFSYILLQAYDFLYLYDNYKCKIQLGGQDQWGNITAGVELIRRMRAKPAGALVYPLIVKADGTKFGKTESGSIWLSGQRTSAYRFYQFWLNTDDRDVVSYLKYFTWLGEEDIRELEAAVAQRPEQREAQRRLAREMTRIVHDETALGKAEQASQALFGGEVAGLSADEIADIFAEVPSGRISGGELKGAGKPLQDLLVECKMAPSKSEARRAIEAGGIYLNNRRIADLTARVASKDVIDNRFLIFRRGRKNYWLVRIE